MLCSSQLEAREASEGDDVVVTIHIRYFHQGFAAGC